MNGAAAPGARSCTGIGGGRGGGKYLQSHHTHRTATDWPNIPTPIQVEPEIEDQEEEEVVAEGVGETVTDRGAIGAAAAAGVRL